MRTVTAASILSGAFAKGGLSVPTSEGALRAALDYLVERLRYATEYYRWPETVEVQYRLFRRQWTAAVWPAGTEVFNGHSYWRATEDTTADDVPGEYGAKGVLLVGEGLSLAYSADGDYIIYSGEAGPSKWVELVRFPKLVSFEQVGEDAIGAFLTAWTEDPRKSSAPRRIPFMLLGEGALFRPEYGNDGVWLAFRPPAQVVTPEIYSASANYAIGTFVYVEDDFYHVVAATTAGDVPSGAAAKFSLVPIPQFLAPALKAGVWSDVCAADGATDKASWWDAKVTDLLDEQVMQITRLQGQTTQLTWDDE